MYQKLFIAMIALLFGSISLANTCPSIKAIKANHLSGWKIYDSDDDKPLTSQLSVQFEKNAMQFVLAEWTKRGSMHCYYRDKQGSNLEAYLAKKDFQPENSQAYWYPVSGFMHCAAGPEKCQFNTIHHRPPQLARK